MKKVIINVGRQIGSGGHDVARLLADHFNCKFYDREVLNLAAKESGFDEKFFEQNDEHKGFFRSLFHVTAPHIGDSSFYGNDLSQEGLFKLQSDAIRTAAGKQSCVFVGRCADYVLRDMENVVNIFITADMEDRVKNVMERRQCDANKARKIIQQGESQRASYYNYYTGKRWGHSEAYDLCLNTSRLGIEGAAAYVKQFIEKVIR